MQMLLENTDERADPQSEARQSSVQFYEAQQQREEHVVISIRSSIDRLISAVNKAVTL